MIDETLDRGAWVFVIAMVVAMGFLFVQSNERQEYVMSVGECVEKMALEDGFVGSLSDAYEVYYETCTNQLKK